MQNNKNNITLSFKNIISFLNNLTGYFTERRKIITLCLLILMLSFVNIILCLPNSFSGNSAFALSYESEVGIGFTFNPTLSINISSPDLVISNLVPGSSNDSNIINVSVLTNASHGYTLAVDTNNENLVHNDNNVNSAFSSIATDADLSSLTADNTWGYSYKLSSNNTWSSYNGLPLHTNTSTTLINTDNQISKPIDFKIGAKAGSTQASGTYTGTINFIAVSKPTPKTIEDIVYMQTFGELVSTDLQSVKNSMVLNQDYILKDSRDEKEYYVTRLEDGNVWMTQNLNLDLVAGITLTHIDTDLGWANLDAEATWTINNSYSTIPWDTTNDAFTGWDNQDNIPYSASPGEKYYYTSDTANPDTAFNSISQCISASHAQENCKHYSSGNYYNWTAAIASNDSSSIISGDAPNSICPAGWRLPKNSENDFANLLVIYSVMPNISATAYNTNGFNIIRNNPLYFVRSGFVDGGAVKQTAYSGFYYPSTLQSKIIAKFLMFSNNTIWPAGNGSRGRSIGMSVRCLAR